MLRGKRGRFLVALGALLGSLLVYSALYPKEAEGEMICPDLECTGLDDSCAYAVNVACHAIPYGWCETVLCSGG